MCNNMRKKIKFITCFVIIIFLLSSFSLISVNHVQSQKNDTSLSEKCTFGPILYYFIIAHINGKAKDVDKGPIWITLEGNDGFTVSGIGLIVAEGGMSFGFHSVTTEHVKFKNYMGVCEEDMVRVDCVAYPRVVV